jgi:hypothetical protein
MPLFRESERFDYGVMLTPLRGPKSEADLAVTIVKAEELTEEKRASMEREGKVGAMVVTEKQRDVLHRDALAPGDAAAEVDALLPFVFPQHHFTEMWRQLDVRPRKGAPEPRAHRSPRLPLRQALQAVRVHRRVRAEVRGGGGHSGEVEGVLRHGAGAQGQFTG